MIKLVILNPIEGIRREEYLLDFKEILLHILSGDLINEALIGLLSYNKDTNLIKKYCNVIEVIWKTGNDEVVNIIY